MEEGFKHWVGVKLTSPTIEGTVGAGTGLTMPAFTADGDISIGANKLITSQGLIKGLLGYGLALRYSDDSDFGLVSLGLLYFTNKISAQNPGISIEAAASDGSNLIFMAQDTGVGLKDVAQLVGAADPYLQLTLGGVFPPIAQPATPVEGWVIYNAATNKLQVWNGAAWETIVSA